MQLLMGLGYIVVLSHAGFGQCIKLFKGREPKWGEVSLISQHLSARLCEM